MGAEDWRVPENSEELRVLVPHSQHVGNSADFLRQLVGEAHEVAARQRRPHVVRHVAGRPQLRDVAGDAPIAHLWMRAAARKHGRHPTRLQLHVKEEETLVDADKRERSQIRMQSALIEAHRLMALSAFVLEHFEYTRRQDCVQRALEAGAQHEKVAGNGGAGREMERALLERHQRVSLEYLQALPDPLDVPREALADQREAHGALVMDRWIQSELPVGHRVVFGQQRFEEQMQFAHIFRLRFRKDYRRFLLPKTSAQNQEIEWEAIRCRRVVVRLMFLVPREALRNDPIWPAAYERHTARTVLRILVAGDECEKLECAERVAHNHDIFAGVRGSLERSVGRRVEHTAAERAVQVRQQVAIDLWDVRLGAVASGNNEAVEYLAVVLVGRASEPDPPSRVRELLFGRFDGDDTVPEAHVRQDTELLGIAVHVDAHLLARRKQVRVLIVRSSEELAGVTREPRPVGGPFEGQRVPWRKVRLKAPHPSDGRCTFE